ncbi:ribosomal protein L34e superfamily protein [Wolffia australiana]
MDPPMVDCRSLIEFCRTFVQRQNSLGSSENRGNRGHSRNRRGKSLNPLSHPFCDRSPLAVMDIVVLFVVIGALGILILPYFKLIFQEAFEFLPVAFDLIGGFVCGSPVIYAVGLLLVLALGIFFWEILELSSRKCSNPYCRGLRNAVEFDIQLEPEECVKHLMPLSNDVIGSCPFELGKDHKELEAELKKMAPINGRTVLIFRSRCGCPRGRMEVWGHRKTPRAKK